MKEILTPIEAGLYLRIHVRTIYRLAEKGLIPALRVRRRWRFNKVALEEWLLGDGVEKLECDEPEPA